VPVLSPEKHSSKGVLVAGHLLVWHGLEQEKRSMRVRFFYLLHRGYCKVIFKVIGKIGVSLADDRKVC
jgi:hypothetical protein